MSRPDETPTDVVLVEAARAGDPAAFDPLVDRYFGMVFTLALGRLGAPEAAEDLAQEVFLRSWLHLDRLDDPRRFAGWITRMTRNLAADWARRGQVRSRLLPMVSLSDLQDEAIPDPRAEGVRGQMETRERTERIQKAVLDLPSDVREVVLLRFMDHLKTGEIARRLDIDPTTVRRRLARGIDRLRETLKRDLADSLEGLRPSRRAVVRTSRIVLAASLLSGGAKASLAAASGNTALLVAESVSAKGTAAALFHTLKSIPATLAGGGVVMGSTKGMVLAGVVFVLTLGGLAYLHQTGSANGRARGIPPAGVGTGRALDAPYGTQPHPSGTSGPMDTAGGKNGSRVARQSGEPGAWTGGGNGVALSGGASGEGESRAVYGSWEEAVQDYLKDHPDEAEGLSQLVRALEGVRPEEVGPHTDLIAQVLSSGWSAAATAKLGPLLESHRDALEAARKAAEAAPFHTPPRSRMDDPAPDFLRVQYVNKLMLLEAQRLDQEGRVDEAVWQAVLAARLSDRFRSPSVNIIDHFIGMVGASAACRVLASSLQDPALSPDFLQQVGHALVELESGQARVDVAVVAEAGFQIDWVRHLLNDPAAREEDLSNIRANNPERAAGLEEAFRDFPAYEQEHRRAVDIVVENIQRPYWERTWYEKEYLESMASNPCVRDFLKTMMEASVRSDTALAHLRLCQALCALRMGRDDLVAALIDPFTGEPFRIANDRIYSLGPDREDQGGVLPYVSSNGVRSPGDMFILLDNPLGT